MQMILSRDEAMQAVVEYLARRGIDVQLRSVDVEVLYPGTSSMTIRVIVGEVELPPHEGPYR